MGKNKLKPKDIGAGMKTDWSEDYYKTPLKSTDWKGQLSDTWKPYEPSKVQTGWSISKGVKDTPYSPMQGDVMNRMGELMRGEAYSPEGKQKIIGGAMAPVQEMAQKMKQQATEGAYARGLGQSGVLQRSHGEIDRSTLARMAEVSGGVEQWATERSIQDAFAAIQAFQQGQVNEREVSIAIEEMKLQNAESNALYAQKYEQLKADINFDDRDMQKMLAELAQTAYQGDADREIAEMQIKNNFNLSVAQLELAKDIARSGEQTDFVDVVGAIFGA